MDKLIRRRLGEVNTIHVAGLTLARVLHGGVETAVWWMWLGRTPDDIGEATSARCVRYEINHGRHVWMRSSPNH